MVAGLSPLVAITLFSTVVTAGIAAFTWQHSDKPGAKTFVAVMVGATLWSVSYAAALSTPDPQLSQTFETAAWIGRLIMPVSWVVFALQYTGRSGVVTKPVVGLLGINPGITIGVLATQDSHQLMWHDYHVVEVAGAAVGTYGNGPWLEWQAIYGYVLIGVGLLILLDMLYSEGRLYRGQGIALVLAAAVPSVANIVWLFKLAPVHSLDLTPGVFSLSGVLFVYALFRQDLFGLVPATRREGQQVALDFFEDGIVMIDGERRIIDVNASAEHFLDYEADAVLGERIDAVVTDASFDPTEERGLVDIDGQKFELTATPIRNKWDRVIGQTLVFHDVTDRVRRKQLLSVLNRVLRHNLRNEINVIRGYAEMLDGDVDGPEAEFVSLIEERSARLVELGNKARDLERVLAREEREMCRFCICELVRTIVADVAARYPTGGVTIDGPERLWIEADSAVIETVLTNVIENALAHNDSDRPEAVVSVCSTKAGVTVEVVDNGPGIPDEELAILDAMEETPLDHGSGLGLWLVTWSVTAIGGDVEFDENEPRGTVVRVQIPDAEAERAAFEPLVE